MRSHPRCPVDTGRGEIVRSSAERRTSAFADKLAAFRPAMWGKTKADGCSPLDADAPEHFRPLADAANFERIGVEFFDAENPRLRGDG